MIDIDIVRVSSISGIKRTKTMKLNPDDLRSYNKGEVNIQDAFPYLSADDREFIMTGITSEEWDNMFREEDK